METPGMRRSDYYYDLPSELIAQDPLSKRSDSRLMVLDRATGDVSHKSFCDITSYLKKGDCLVLNNTRVIPARLYGKKEKTGATIEILLLKNLGSGYWECLVRPGKKCKIGTKIVFAESRLYGSIVDVLESGNRIIDLFSVKDFNETIDELGEMPIPPYINHELKDRSRYQTVYAKHNGSAAAPTAGLHFTEELLDEIRGMGVKIAEITLHVGLGTFRPVKEENILDHHMHEEFYEVTKESASTINTTKARGGRIIAVGTTSARALEAVASETGGYIFPKDSSTDIFIYPGYEFKVIDALVTNFHLPESTLLMLVSAFAGRENVLSAYQQAIDEKYRFFSFGDAMLLI